MPSGQPALKQGYTDEHQGQHPADGAGITQIAGLEADVAEKRQASEAEVASLNAQIEDGRNTLASLTADVSKQQASAADNAAMRGEYMSDRVVLVLNDDGTFKLGRRGGATTEPSSSGVAAARSPSRASTRWRRTP